MNRREGLVPEVRMDRNGRPVRRWVRPRSASPGPVPPPAVAPRKDRTKQENVQALVEAVDSVLGPGSAVLDAVKLAAQWRITEDTVSRLADAILSSDDRRRAGGLTGMLVHGNAETRIREFIEFGPTIHKDDRDFLRAEAAVRGLHEYDESIVPKLADLTAADEPTKEACRALASVAYGLTCLSWSLTSGALTEIDPAEEGDDGEYEPDEEPMPTLDDWDLIRLVQEHPEDADDIVALIGMHGFESADRLREMLYEGSRSLAEGHL